MTCTNSRTKYPQIYCSRLHTLNRKTMHKLRTHTPPTPPYRARHNTSPLWGGRVLLARTSA